MEDSGRREEIRNIQKEYSWLYPIAVYVLVLAIGIVIGAYIFRERDGYDINIWTEALGVAGGAGVTVFILDRLNDKRDRTNLKRRLVREVGSGSREFALNAISWLRAEGWLSGERGLLKGKNLRGANLKGASLYFRDPNGGSSEAANLEGAILHGANLESATMNQVNLQNAELTGANLHKACLDNAELQGADLGGSNMESTRMYGAHLQGADLRGSDMNGTKLIGAEMPGAVLFAARNMQDADFQGSTMPNGKPYVAGTPLESFTQFSDSKFSETYEEINKIRRGMGLPTFHVVLDGANFIPPIRVAGSPGGFMFVPLHSPGYVGPIVHLRLSDHQSIE